MRRLISLAALSLLAATVPLGAQQTPPAGMQHKPGMQHMPDMQHDGSAAQPTHAGQAAFAAVSEIVKLLEADKATDWTKVDLDALRQHFIDMDAVTMRAAVLKTPTAGGLVMDVTGDAPVAEAIRRMVGGHAPMLEAMGGWRATTAPIDGGIRFTVVASDPSDAAIIARIRGLGFIGLMTQGAHHTQHHLAIATGAGAHAHAKP
jgi:hypothetical protein